METKLAYRVRIEYELVLGEELPCQAHLTVILPADQSKELHPLLRNYDLVICQERLNPCWGKLDEKSRIRSKTIKGEDWVSLGENLEDFKNEVKVILQESFDFSRGLVHQTPDNSDTEYYLD